MWDSDLLDQVRFAPSAKTSSYAVLATLGTRAETNHVRWQRFRCVEVRPVVLLEQLERELLSAISTAPRLSTWRDPTPGLPQQQAARQTCETPVFLRGARARFGRLLHLEPLQPL
jgi:hypothetical protein